MAYIADNLILETCSLALATTNSVPLGGTLPGFRTFSSKCAHQDTVHYMIRAVDNVGRPTGDWEAGRGVVYYDSPSTTWFIVRNPASYAACMVVASSNSDAYVFFSAGLKHVTLACLAPSVDQIRFDQQSALGLDFVGALQYFAATSAPPGWLKANGAAVSRTTYARLFARVSTVYGSGDGSTTFNVPDMRGEFLRGLDDGRGVDSGRTLGTFQGSQNLSHAHGVSDPTHAHSVYDPTHAHSAWTDAQGYHDHDTRSGPNNSGYGMVGGGGWVNSAAVIDLNNYRTSADGSHGHNVGVAGAGTGIGIYAAGTGIWINNDGGAEARPRNQSALICVKF